MYTTTPHTPPARRHSSRGSGGVPTWLPREWWGHQKLLWGGTRLLALLTPYQRRSFPRHPWHSLNTAARLARHVVLRRRPPPILKGLWRPPQRNGAEAGVGAPNATRAAGQQLHGRPLRRSGDDPQAQVRYRRLEPAPGTTCLRAQAAPSADSPAPSRAASKQVPRSRCPQAVRW